MDKEILVALPDPAQDADISVLWTELEVARLSTEGNLEDLKFPENMGHGSTVQLSANTLKQNGRNGRLEFGFVLTALAHLSIHLLLNLSCKSSLLLLSPSPSSSYLQDHQYNNDVHWVKFSVAFYLLFRLSETWTCRKLWIPKLNFSAKFCPHAPGVTVIESEDLTDENLVQIFFVIF